MIITHSSVTAVNRLGSYVRLDRNIVPERNGHTALLRRDISQVLQYRGQCVQKRDSKCQQLEELESHCKAVNTTDCTLSCGENEIRKEPDFTSCCPAYEKEDGKEACCPDAVDMDSDDDFPDSMSDMSDFSEDDCESDVDDSDFDGADFEADTESNVSIRMDNQRVLSMAELLAQAEERALEVQRVVATTPTNCRVVLSLSKWDVAVVLEKMVDRDGLEGQLEAQKLKPSSGEPLPWSGRGRCDLCFEEVDKTVLFDCATRTCRPCLLQYFRSEVRSRGKPFITCPGFKCGRIIDDDEVWGLLEGDEHATNNFKRLIVDHFVQSDSTQPKAWCPGVDCGRAVKVFQRPSASDSKAVRCQCGREFCFLCQGDRHEPVSCENLQRWLDKTSEDNGTHHWLKANTKKCPKCQADIEKNGGCHRMMCYQSHCRYEFCWNCMKDWNVHGYDKPCNRFDEEAERKRDQSERHESVVWLNRFIHYLTRYETHLKSLEFNQKLYDKVARLAEHILSSEMGINMSDMSFLEKAVKLLMKCRKTLMYTYPFAYYVERSNEVTIFEDNQADLERAVEQLTAYLETSDLKDQDLLELRRNIMDKTAYVEKRNNALLKHWQEGEEGGVWKCRERL
uniref:RBR-type E3 ubiquitin transferase n=1 Tax=Steinernema glaseri TaxID=37863 RepID=A0A1I7YZZ6_9BILA